MKPINIPCLTSISNQRAISSCTVQRGEPNDLYTRCIELLGHPKMIFNPQQAQALAQALIEAAKE